MGCGAGSGIRLLHSCAGGLCDLSSPGVTQITQVPVECVIICLSCPGEETRNVGGQRVVKKRSIIVKRRWGTDECKPISCVKVCFKKNANVLV